MKLIIEYQRSRTYTERLNRTIKRVKQLNKDESYHEGRKRKNKGKIKEIKIDLYITEERIKDICKRYNLKPI